MPICPVCGEVVATDDHWHAEPCYETLAARRYARCTDDCTTDCGACKGQGRLQ